MTLRRTALRSRNIITGILGTATLVRAQGVGLLIPAHTSPASSDVACGPRIPPMVPPNLDEEQQRLYNNIVDTRINIVGEQALFDENGALRTPQSPNMTRSPRLIKQHAPSARASRETEKDDARGPTRQEGRGTQRSLRPRSASTLSAWQLRFARATLSSRGCTRWRYLSLVSTGRHAACLRPRRRAASPRAQAHGGCAAHGRHSPGMWLHRTLMSHSRCRGHNPHWAFSRDHPPPVRPAQFEWCALHGALFG
jgi:hypothetical protein